jgi:uncharacterized membrane protein YfcA
MPLICTFSNLKIMTPLNKKKMDMQTIGILIALGMATGALSSVVGVGGGIILVPALIYIFGYPQMDAQGVSLALLMFPVGMLGVIQYYKAGHVNFNLVGIIAIGFVIGSFFGSKLALSLPHDVIKKAFAILMLVIAIKMLFFDQKKPVETNTSLIK